MALIEDYGLIGDLQTAALVEPRRLRSTGSACRGSTPARSSPRCSASAENGHWTIQPAGEFRSPAGATAATRSSSRPSSRPTTAPCGSSTSCRRARRSPTSSASSRAFADASRWHGARAPLRLRLDRARGCATIDGTLVAIAGPDAVLLRTPVELEGRDLRTYAVVHRRRGRPRAVRPHVVSVERASSRRGSTRRRRSRTTVSFWEEWAVAVHVRGPLGRRRPPLAAHAEGAHVRADRRDRRGADDVAAGVDRRRAQLGLPLLLAARRDADAARVHPRRLRRGGGRVARLAAPRDRRRRRTTCRSCTASPASGGSPSSSCRGSPGYEGSRPVRIGNGASDQLQLDVYGEVVDALYQARRKGLGASDDAWALARKTFDWLESGWRQEDEGIWEVRGPRRHFTHSKVMAWVAFDRAVKTVEKLGRDGPRRPLAGGAEGDQGRSAARGLQRRARRVLAVLRLGSARCELPPDPARRLPSRDRRARRRHRSRDRAATSCATASSSATAPTRRTSASTGCRPARASSCRARSGSRRAAASRGGTTRRWSCTSGCSALRNDLGLISEEYDPERGRLVGNFPQAFTHIGIVETAFTLSRTDLRRPRRAATRRGCP